MQTIDEIIKGIRWTDADWTWLKRDQETTLRKIEAERRRKEQRTSSPTQQAISQATPQAASQATSQVADSHKVQYHINKAVVEQMMSYDSTLIHYLDRLGIDTGDVDKLIADYKIGSPNNHTAVLWRMDSKGTPINGNVIVYDEEKGDIITCHRIYWRQDLILHDYNFGIAFFGGQLLGDNRYKGKFVGVVQEELTALLGTLTFPKFLWLAVGHAQNLTAEHLSLLKGRRTVLYPDDMAVDVWREVAARFPNVEVSKVFTTRDAKAYFINIINE